MPNCTRIPLAFMLAGVLSVACVGASTTRSTRASDRASPPALAAIATDDIRRDLFALARDGIDLATWGDGSSAPRSIRDGEAAHEQQVSRYLCAMSVLWINVPDEAGPASERAVIERHAIALLSNQYDPIDPPSDKWLGRYSIAEQVRRSGLWNVKHVRERYDSGLLDLLHHAVTRTLALTA